MCSSCWISICTLYVNNNLFKTHMLCFSISFSDHDEFVRQTAMNMGNTSNAANAGQQHPSPAALPLSSRTTSVIPSPIPPLRIPSPPLPLSSTPLLPLHDHTDSKTSGNHAANLVKPSSFFATPPTSSPLMIPTISSSAPTAPPLQPPVNLQRPYGTPMLQPFPPSTPPPSLTPNPTYGAVITRDKVRDALLRLSQVCLLHLVFSHSLLSLHVYELRKWPL